MKKYVFLDRDGTLIVNKHYLHDPDGVEFCEGAIEALQQLKTLGYQFVVVTNQSGIGRGYFAEQAMHDVHHKIRDMLREHGLQIVSFLVCPHAPEDNCKCRKPEPGMLTSWKPFAQVDKDASFVVGDRLCDVLLASNVGLKGILVHAGPVESEEQREASQRAILVVENLLQVAQWAQKRSKTPTR